MSLHAYKSSHPSIHFLCQKLLSGLLIEEATKNTAFSYRQHPEQLLRQKSVSVPFPCSHLPLIFSPSVTSSSTQLSLQWLNQHRRRCSALLAAITVQTAVLNPL